MFAKEKPMSQWTKENNKKERKARSFLFSEFFFYLFDRALDNRFEKKDKRYYNYRG